MKKNILHKRIAGYPASAILPEIRQKPDISSVIGTYLWENVRVPDDDEKSLGPGDRHVQPLIENILYIFPGLIFSQGLCYKSLNVLALQQKFIIYVEKVSFVSCKPYFKL